MKRIAILTFVLILICSTVAFASNEIKINAGVFDTVDADDILYGGKASFRTDVFALAGVYDFLGLQYTGAGDFNSDFEYDHGFHDLNLLMFNQVTSVSDDLYMGLGGKYLLIENSSLLDDLPHENVYVDIAAFGLPVVVDAEEAFSEYFKVDLQGNFIPVGRYTIPIANHDDVNGSFMGYGVDLAIKLTPNENFALQIGGTWQEYSFAEDEELFFSQNFTDTQRGLYGGIEIAW